MFYERYGGHATQELLESLTFAEECGKLISPPCWKTGRFCTGKLSAPLTSSKTAKPSDLLNRAHAAGLDVYPFTFRNEVQLPCYNSQTVELLDCHTLLCHFADSHLCSGSLSSVPLINSSVVVAITTGHLGFHQTHDL